MPIYTLSRELVEAIAREYGDLESLNLSENCISVLENLDPLTSLTKLDLSGNELLAVSNAQQLTNLQQLYLQNNKIEYVCPRIGYLKDLSVLDLSNNCLQDLSRLVPILQSLPSLQHLSLQGNPCCSQPNYAQYLLAACPRLLTLDELSREDALAAATTRLCGIPSAPCTDAARTMPSQRNPLAEVNTENGSLVGQPTVIAKESSPRVSPPSYGVSLSLGRSNGTAAPEAQVPTEVDNTARPSSSWHSAGGLGTEQSFQTRVGTSYQAEVAATGAVTNATVGSSGGEPQNAKVLPLSSHEKCTAPIERPSGSGCGPARYGQQRRDDSLISDLKRRLEASEREGASLRSSLQSALLSAESEREVASRCQRELDKLHERLADREATVVSLRAYIGRSATWSSNTESKDPSNTESTVSIPGEANRGLLETHISALQEILAVQEEAMAAGQGPGREGSEAKAVLSRWRQEVFQGILGRKAAEVRLRETDASAAKRMAEVNEQLQKAEYAAKVAQQKMVASDMEVKRATVALAETQAEARAADRRAASWERRAMAAHREAEEMAGAVKAGRDNIFQMEKRLEDGGKLLAAFSRRVAFAEERLHVLQALLKGKIQKVDHDETPPMYSAREEVAPASELQREVDALRAERQLLLSRLDGHPAEVTAAASAAAAEARAAAAAESERTVAGVEEAASRRLEEREAELTAELSEMEAEVSRVEEERQEVMRQLEECKVEARAQQADLASCKRSLAEARKAADEAKVARVEAESQAGRRLKESNERHSNELATLRAHHEEEHRQGAKAMVTVRQLERQLARLHDKRSQSSATEIELLEGKLEEKDAALRAARRERNALLAEKRAAEGKLREQCRTADAASPKPAAVWGRQAGLRRRNGSPSQVAGDQAVSGPGQVEPVRLDGVFQRQNGSGAALFKAPAPPRSMGGDNHTGGEFFERLDDLEKLTESLLDDDLP